MPKTDKYADLDAEEFIRILSDIVDEESDLLLSIPGIYEILSEHYNNDVLERWEREQQESATEADD